MGHDYYRDCLNSYEQYVIDNFPDLIKFIDENKDSDLALAMKKLYIYIAGNIFLHCDKSQSDNLKELPEIDRLRMIKKKREVKSGLFGLQKKLKNMRKIIHGLYQLGM